MKESRQDQRKKNLNINEKDYLDGLEYVIQTAHKNFSGVSMLQQLNAVYGMANQSLNQLAEERRVN